MQRPESVQELVVQRPEQAQTLLRQLLAEPDIPAMLVPAQRLVLPRSYRILGEHSWTMRTSKPMREEEVEKFSSQAKVKTNPRKASVESPVRN